MQIDKRQAPILRHDPRNCCKQKGDGKRPSPIAFRTLLSPQIEQKPEPQHKRRVPRGGESRPTVKAPHPVAAREIERQIRCRQHKHSADADRVKKTRPSPTQRHPRGEVAKLHKIMDARKQKDRRDRHLQRETADQDGRNGARSHERGQKDVRSR